MTSAAATLPSAQAVPEGTLAWLVHEQTLRQPDAPALLAPGRPSSSYRQLWQQMGQIADALRSHGVRPSERVAVMLGNGPEMVAAFLGVAACASFVPLNPAYQAAELRVHLAQTRSHIVIVGDDERGPVRTVAGEMGLAVLEVRVDEALPAGRFDLAVRPLAHAEPPRPAQPHDAALLLPTSGTTARPKIVQLTHAHLVRSVGDIVRHFALSASDRCLNIRPLFHVNGLVSTVLATLASGGSVVCTPGLDAQVFFDWVARFRPTWFSAVPTMHQWLLVHGEQYRRKAPDHRFRFVRSGSAALAPTTLKAIEGLTGAPLIETYGMTERTPIAINPLPPGQRKPGSVGRPVGVELALLDEAGRPVPEGGSGEIAIRSADVVAGYQDDDGAAPRQPADGWFRTGDQGRFDDEGYLYITGRLKELINRGGQKIAPREVDEALLEHPAVAQAAAFGVPHPTLGEDVAAAVVLRDGALADEAALRGFLSTRLASFKMPSAIVFVAELAAGHTGKIKRTQLYESLADLLPKGFAAALTDTQRSIEAIFGEVLGRGPIGRHDSFFALGGDSLSGTRVIARINERHAVSLAIASLFAHPSVAELAQVVDDAAQTHPRTADDLAQEIAQMSDDEVRRLLAQEDPATHGGNTDATPLSSKCGSATLLDPWGRE